jgi:membrane associated rhomboid family serine protease
MALASRGGRLLPRAAVAAFSRAAGARTAPPLLPHRLLPLPSPPPSQCSGAASAAHRAFASWQPAWRSPPPPSLPARLRASLDANPDNILYGLIAANCAVYAAWQTQPPRWMARHFMVWPHDAFTPQRAYTMLTAAFSQRDGWHLAGNMVSLYFFGREVGRLFGGGKLLGLYLAGGVAASAAHVAWSRREWRASHSSAVARAWGAQQRGSVPALGASGAVNAVVLFNTLLWPWRIIYVNFFIPVPAILLGGGVLLRDAWGAWEPSAGQSSGVAHAGHVGGAAVGAAAWAALKIRTRRGGW